jgi:prevent-host-death family protein
VEIRISAREANQQFSQLLRRVRDGETFIVTSHGRPVAKIGPLDVDERAREAAWEALFEHLRAQKPMNAGKWTREELYDRSHDEGSD